MNLREIKELGLNQVFKKKKTLINKPMFECIGVAIQLLQLPSVIYIFLKRKIYWRVGTKNLGSNSL